MNKNVSVIGVIERLQDGYSVQGGFININKDNGYFTKNYKNYGNPYPFKGFPDSFSVFYKNKPILHKDKNFVWILPENLPKQIEEINSSNVEFS